MDTSFRIYNASAGSGKTYTLTKEYLKIILSSPKSYKQILAITFTNKAVSEMRHRILGSLYDFSQIAVPQKSLGVFDAIGKELQIDAPTLTKKAKATLKDILHNYAFFDISTIDRFTHRLIRTFAKDLRIPQNFEVILDTDLLLDEAIARLINKAGTDKKLTKVLIDFALEKIDDDKSWDVTFDLNKMGKLLFNENQKPHLQKLVHKDIEAFSRLRTNILKKTRFLEKEILAAASKTLVLIAENGLQFDDFIRSYFPKFMLKISEGDLNIDFRANWKQNFETDPLYNKSCPESTKMVLDGLHPEFIALFNTIKTGTHDYMFLKNVYSNLVPLTVLNAIQIEVKNLLAERDQLSISEFNTIISKEIRNQPAPFIYERLGEKYRHYFIDEFQDTSMMQWANLIPLVSNALESQDEDGNKGSLFLVGDVKQAIYRWRGGKAEQFLSLVNESANPFMVSPQIELLPKNYRSHAEIVNFNNDFFTLTSPLLNNQTYHDMFRKGNKQLHSGKEGGMVQITFLKKGEEKDIAESYCEEVLATIKSIQHKNYSLSDITVLVRDNKHGIILADYLTDQGIPIISPDSLLINSSAQVKFLVRLLLLSDQPEDLENVFNILSYLAPRENKKHEFIKNHIFSLNDLLREEFGFDIGFLKQTSVYDGLEYAIKCFCLAENSNAHITFFMDAVHEVELKEGAGIQAFLSYWEKKKDKLSIAAPNNVNAVQIMSIHKAKGLEFPIVIFPFANSHIYKEINPKLWLKVDKESFNGFDEVLINKKKEVVDYGPYACLLYEEEQHKLELDAFNVLYVALTRARKALYVISEKDLTKTGSPRTEYYSGLFIQYLQDKNLWDDHRNSYVFGHLNVLIEMGAGNVQENIDYQYTFKERAGFKILAKSGMLWDTERENALAKGNLIHNALRHIETKKDIPKALDYLQRNGDLHESDINDISKKIKQIVDHQELYHYYEDGYTIMNERDIITAHGAILRPDRIMIKNKTATLIDYKSGKKNPAYKEQLYSYADALQHMGYEVDKKIIVYIDEIVTSEFI